MGVELKEEDIPSSLRNYKAMQSETVDNVENIPQNEEKSGENISLEENNTESTLGKAIDYERKLFSARSLRSGRRAGKH